MYKKCCRCKDSKELSEFNKNQSMCKSCFKEYQSVNKDSINKTRRESPRTDHMRELNRIRNKEYRLRNKEQINERLRIKRADNKNE